MALVEGCKHELEISIPVEEVEKETAKVAGQFRERVHLKGFRAGKAPMSLIRKNYASDIRQRVALARQWAGERDHESIEGQALFGLRHITGEAVEDAAQPAPIGA